MKLSLLILNTNFFINFIYVYFCAIWELHNIARSIMLFSVICQSLDALAELCFGSREGVV
jgi:hypothetical protein